MIKKTVCYNADSKYLTKYVSYLKEYSACEYFNMNYINSVFDTTKKNYDSVYRPTISELIGRSINFNMNDNNYNISEFIKNIKENIQKIKN